MQTPKSSLSIAPTVSLARSRILSRTQGSSPAKKIPLPYLGLRWRGKTLGHTYLGGKWS